MTQGIQSLVMDGLNPYTLLIRNNRGDWGDMCDDDLKANDRAVRSGEERIFSSYETTVGKVWIITEADRSLTTILLPDEY